MTPANNGPPPAAMVGDEIFDQSSALGTADFLANVDLRRAWGASSRASLPR